MLISDHEEFDHKEAFTIKFGEAVRKKKEEIENIYKEEDKKKERLKLEYNSFVGNMGNKIQDLKTVIRQERVLTDTFTLNVLQKNNGENNKIKKIEQIQNIGKRNSIDVDSDDEQLENQTSGIDLKK